MKKSDLKKHIKEEILSILKEGELNIPTPSGTSSDASSEQKAAAQKASAAGTMVKYIKKGQVKETQSQINSIKNKLDSLGVKYDISTTDKVKQFKVIYKPTNKPDEWYVKFDNIIDLNNLKGVVKSAIKEAKKEIKVGDKVTYLGYPGVITAVNKEMTGATTYNVSYDKGNGKTKASNIYNKDGEIKPLTEDKNDEKIKVGDIVAKKYASTDEDYTKNFKVTALTGTKAALKDTKTDKETGMFISDLYKTSIKETESTETYMISKAGSKGIPYYVLEKPDGSKQIDMMFSSPEEAKKYATKKNLKLSSKKGYNMNESKGDKVDTITMDIPLFIRMLEYAREDASQDVDLHDVTEKATLLGKERGILQMEDYNEIITSSGDVKEAKIESDFFEREPKSKDIEKGEGIIAKTKKLLNFQKELKTLSKDMQDLAAEYREAEGSDKDEILRSLKVKTAAKKELEKKIEQLEKYV
jgi:hypothetical protein